MTHQLNPVEPIDGSFAPRPAPELVSLEFDGELLVLDPRTDGLHHLDRLATIIWKVLDGSSTVDELVDDLADAFGTPAHLVRTDLDELLTEFRAVGLLDGSDPPAHLLLAAKAPRSPDSETAGAWRPEYLVDPPAP